MKSVLAVLLLFLPALANATTLYVNPSCTNGITTYNPAPNTCTGGSSTVYNTINHATDAMASGDTVDIRAGTYNEQVGNNLTPNQSGTASITGWGTSTWSETGATIIQGHPGETVTLAGSNVNGTAIGFSTPGGATIRRLFVFRNLKVNGANNGGVALGGGGNGGTIDHIKLDNIEVFGTTTSQPSAAAFTFGGDSFPNQPDTTEVWLTNSSAHDSAPGQEEFHIHCWYVAFGDSIIENSTCYNWHIGYALQINTGTFQPPNNVYRNLLIHDINANSQNNAAIVFNNGTGNTVQNSLIYDNDDGIRIHNNDHANFINNTIFRNGVRSGHAGVTVAIDFDNTNGPGRVAVNNILFGNRDNSINNADTTATNTTSNPGFVNTGSNPPNLQLATASGPAYNAGTNAPYCGPGTGVTTDFAGTSRPQGGTCDIGAYEFVSARYVDNTSSCPGAGTTGSPWCSIQQALTSMSGGDDVKIRTGTGVYSETASISGKSGSSGSPSILEPDTGAVFVIRNTSSTQAVAAVQVTESDYWTFQNLVFDANGVTPGLYGLKIQCQTKDCVGIVVQNNQFKNWRQSLAYTTWGSTVLTIAGSDTSIGASANHWVTATITGNYFSSNDDSAMYNYRLLNGSISNNEITDQRCGADDNGQDVRAIGIWIGYQSTGVTISGNTIHDFQSYGGCARTLPSFPTWAGIWCDTGGHTQTWKQNTIFNIDQNGDPTDTSKQVHGMFVEAGCDGFTVEQNVIYDVRTYGITNSYHPNNALTSPFNNYYNNTIYHTGWAFDIKEGRALLKNNIFSTSSQTHICYGCTSGNPAIISISGTDYNLYDGTNIAVWSGIGNLNFAQWKSQCGCDTNAKNANPQFVSLVTPDLHLQSSSPAIDAGTNVGLPFMGSAPDMGYAEFQASTPSIVVTSPTLNATYTTTVNTITISGTTTGAITSVTWSNDKGGSGSASGTAIFTTPAINLQADQVNTITLTANFSGGSTSTTLIVAYSFPALVGAWAFDETSGTTAIDSSAKANNGTLTGSVSYTASIVKYGASALSFSGGNVTVPDAASLRLIGGWTITAQVYPFAAHTDFRAILVKNIDYYLYASSTSNYCAGNSVLTGDITANACAPSPLPINQFSCVASRYDGNTLTIEINKQVVAAQASIGILGANTGTLQIATSQFNEPFDGVLDNIRLYNSDIGKAAADNDCDTPIIPAAMTNVFKAGAGTTFKAGAGATFKGGH